MSGPLDPHLPPHTIPAIQQFLRGHLEESGAKGVIVGLSGGIDSALVARLARDALGPERVMGLSLPDANFPADLRGEIRDYAASLGIGFREIPIADTETAIERALAPDGLDLVARGNLKARVRMILDYTEAHARSFLVAGTGNKSEILLGYFTKYGDGGVDLLPVGDLYKTSVFELGRELSLPETVLARPPTAGLWEGQTDEEELGFTYAFADQVLVGLERLLEPDEIAEKLGVPLEKVEPVVRRVHANRHKRRPAPIAKLSLRTVGVDWRD